MAGFWTLYKLEATQNYLPNPSLEDGTTGYSAYSSGTAAGTRTRGATWQKRDYYGYRLVKSGGGASDHWGVGVAANSPSDFISGESVTFSVDLNVAASTTVEIEIEATVGGTPESTTLEVAASSAGRYSVTHTLSGNATAITARVYIKSATGTVDIDGLQVENKTYQTSYCDGDQDGCKWLGAQHNSSSTRNRRSGAGGRPYNLDDLDLYVETPTGWGMPPIRHQVQQQAQLPGSLWRGTRVEPRVITISGPVMGSTHEDLHLERKDLIEALKADATAGDPLILEYTGANSAKPIRLFVRYDTGLEGGVFAGFAEQVNIRLIAYDPFWFTDGNTADSISGKGSAVTSPRLARRNSAGWHAVAASLNGTVRAIVEGPDGTIYFGGDFTNAGGVANADYVAMYDPETDTITAMGTGMDGPVLALVAHPTGQIYAGGSFNLAGGVANTQYFTRWTGSGWLRMVSAGNLFDDVVRALVVTPAGDIIVGGDFANANGAAYAGIVSNTLGVTENYTAMGTGTAGGDVYALAVTNDGTVYAGGDFTTMGGVASTARLAAWGGTTWTALGTGANGTVYALLGHSSGLLYAGGDFTQLNGSGDYVRIGTWNTIAFGQVSANGCDDTVRGLFEDDQGWVHIVGRFDSAGLLDDDDLQYYAIWNGTLMLYPDGGPIETVSDAFCILIASNGDLYIGSNSQTGVLGAGFTTVTNDGSREVYPVITITNATGTARLIWIKNETTGATLYFDYAFVGSAVEWLTIDLRPNRRRVYSNYRGAVWSAIKPASDVNAFTLVPGDNVISVRMVDAGTPTVLLQWAEQYWSADGVAS